MKKFRCTFSLFMAVVILMSIIPLKASALDNFECSGLIYRLQDDKAIIEGYSETNDTDKLIIPEKIDGYEVWAIDTGAFTGCQVTEIYVPQTVEIIAPLAFAGCGKIDFEQFVDDYVEFLISNYNENYDDAEKQQIKNLYAEQIIEEFKNYSDLEKNRCFISSLLENGNGIIS